MNEDNKIRLIKIGRIHDGDSFKDCTINLGLNIQLYEQSIRLYGIDTPEVFGEQNQAGVLVRDYVKNLIFSGKNERIRLRNDVHKYGEVLAEVIIDGLNINTHLLDKLFAHPYQGGKKPLWTSEQLNFIVNELRQKIFSNSKLNTMASENRLGFNEVIDTLGDLVAAVGPNGVREVFDGKFELVKFLIKAAEVYPSIKEAIDDFPTFWAQLKDLTPAESLQVAGAIKARFPDPDNVQSLVINVIENLALTQDYIQSSVIEGAKALVGKWSQT